MPSRTSEYTSRFVDRFSSREHSNNCGFGSCRHATSSECARSHLLFPHIGVIKQYHKPSPVETLLCPLYGPFVPGHLACSDKYSSTELDNILLNRPLSSSNSRESLIDLLRGFSKEISKYTSALPPSFQSDHATLLPNDLDEEVNIVYGQFSLAIQQTVPRFRPWLQNYLLKGDTLRAMITKSESSNTPGGDGTVLHLDDVMALVDRAHAEGGASLSVKNSIFRESTKEWRRLADNCCTRVEKIVFKHLDLLLDSYLSTQSHLRPSLVNEIRRVIAEEIRKRRLLMHERITSLCAAEQNGLTQNNRPYLDYCNKWRSLYAATLHEWRGIVFEGIGLSNSGAIWGTATWDGAYINTEAPTAPKTSVISPDLVKLFHSGPTDSAVQVMADVRAYFEVASNRFNDEIARQLKLAFAQGLDETMNLALTRFATGISDEDCMDSFPSNLQDCGELGSPIFWGSLLGACAFGVFFAGWAVLWILRTLFLLGIGVIGYFYSANPRSKRFLRDLWRSTVR